MSAKCQVFDLSILIFDKKMKKISLICAALSLVVCLIMLFAPVSVAVVEAAPPCSAWPEAQEKGPFDTCYFCEADPEDAIGECTCGSVWCF